MALSPVSRSCVSSPSLSSASGIERPANPRPAITGMRQLEPLRQLLQSDGFDAPGGAAKGHGVEALAQRLTGLARMLTDVSRVLGGEGVQAPQGGARPAAALDGAGAAPAPQGVDQPEPAAASAAPGVSKEGNTITFSNDGKSPMTIQFTPNAGEKTLDSITLEPGKTRTVQFPENWSGNFRSTAGDGSAATLGEVKFDGGFGKTYYDVSYIEGHNASMTIQPEEGGRVSGTHDDLLASAPDAIKARNADGSAYGIKKSTTSNVQDASVVDFYRKHVGADEGYVIPTDDASTLGSGDKNLVVRMKNLA